jgi:hypothetical protein
MIELNSSLLAQVKKTSELLESVVARLNDVQDFCTDHKYKFDVLKDAMAKYCEESLRTQDKISEDLAKRSDEVLRSFNTMEGVIRKQVVMLWFGISGILFGLVQVIYQILK